MMSFEEEIKELGNYASDSKHRELMHALLSNLQSAKELIQGIDNDNSQMLGKINDISGSYSIKDSNSYKNIDLNKIKQEIDHYSAILKSLSSEIDKGLSNKEYVVKLCASLMQTKTVIDKEFSKLTGRGLMDRIRKKGGLLSKFFAALGIATALNVSTPKDVKAGIPPIMTMTNMNPVFAYSMISQAIVKNAQEQLGKEYKWGSVGPSNFDCSGLVQYIYNNQGIKMPRTAFEQSKVGELISSKNIEPDKIIPGDLLFFTRSGSKVGHVGIYVGNKIDEYGNTQLLMIHAPRKGAKIRYESINNNYWQKRFVLARRVIGNQKLQM